MIEQIIVDTESLVTKAQQARELNEKQNRVVQRVYNLVSALKSEWTGVASDEMAATLASLKPEFDRFSECILKYAQSMEDASNKMMIKDEKLASEIKQLL